MHNVKIISFLSPVLKIPGQYRDTHQSENLPQKHCKSAALDQPHSGF